MLEGTGHQSCYPRGERYRLLVYNRSEHHVGHFVELARDGLNYVRVAIAVACRPPRSCSVYEFSAIGKGQFAPLRPIHANGASRLFTGTIRKPEMRKCMH